MFDETCAFKLFWLKLSLYERDAQRIKPNERANDSRVFFLILSDCSL